MTKGHSLQESLTLPYYDLRHPDTARGLGRVVVLPIVQTRGSSEGIFVSGANKGRKIIDSVPGGIAANEVVRRALFELNIAVGFEPRSFRTLQAHGEGTSQLQFAIVHGVRRAQCEMQPEYQLSALSQFVSLFKYPADLRLPPSISLGVVSALNKIGTQKVVAALKDSRAPLNETFEPWMT